MSDMQRQPAGGLNEQTEDKQRRKMSLVEPGHTGTQLFQFCGTSEESHKKAERDSLRMEGTIGRWKWGCLAHGNHATTICSDSLSDS